MTTRVRRACLAAAVAGIAALPGCANVGERTVDPWDRYARSWSNALAAGKPSRHTRDVVAMLELNAICRTDWGRCADSVRAAGAAIDTPDRLLAAAELDYLAGRREGADRYWSCVDSAYRMLSGAHPGGETLITVGPLSLATGLYDVCLDRALGTIVQRTAPLESRYSHGPYDITIEWPAELAHGATLRAASEVDVSRFLQHRMQAGLGAPYVLIPEPPDASAPPLVPPGGLVVPLTAIARFDTAAETGPIRSHVRFVAPHGETRVEFGGFAMPLAADYTAPLALMVDALDEAVERVRRLLRPGQQPDLPDVYAVTPYDPQRVTVVMIHGLGSGPLAWLDLTNNLLGDARLRSKIQVWHCRYASGYPWLYNRHAIARRLDEARRLVDPELDDRGTNDIVLIGHSMGGVLARLLVSSSGDSVWQAMFPGADAGLVGGQDDIETVRQYLYFEPLPYVRRAVFIAAPQRGAPMAAGTSGRLLGSLIELPPETFEPFVRLARDNPQAVDPQLAKAYRRGGPRSVDMLAPDHPMIRASIELPIAAGVPVHVISGTGWPVDGEPGDGLVAVSSTLVPGAQSTLLVRATHEVQKNPGAILEIERILREHVAAAD